MHSLTFLDLVSCNLSFILSRVLVPYAINKTHVQCYEASEIPFFSTFLYTLPKQGKDGTSLDGWRAIAIYPKSANWCFDALCKRLNVFPNLTRDSLTILSRIDRHPPTRLSAQTLKQRPHASLQRFLLVTLLAVAASRRSCLGREIEEEGEVRRGEADVGRATPGEREALGGRERDAGEGVAIAEHRSARRELRFQRAGGLPSVCREEQVDGAVV